MISLIEEFHLISLVGFLTSDVKIFWSYVIFDARWNFVRIAYHSVYIQIWEELNDGLDRIQETTLNITAIGLINNFYILNNYGNNITLLSWNLLRVHLVILEIQVKKEAQDSL